MEPEERNPVSRRCLELSTVLKCLSSGPASKKLKGKLIFDSIPNPWVIIILEYNRAQTQDA